MASAQDHSEKAEDDELGSPTETGAADAEARLPWREYQCSGTTSRGAPCSIRVRGRDWCHYHFPAELRIQGARAFLEGKWGRIVPGTLEIGDLWSRSPTEQVKEMRDRAGRACGPLVLWDWWCLKLLPSEDLHHVIAEIWRHAACPEAAIGTDNWVRLFRSAGYVTDSGIPAPTASLPIYRCAMPGYERGMAWTSEIAVARHMLNHQFGPTLLLTTIIPPEGVLARLSEETEKEIIVDPAWLPEPGPTVIGERSRNRR
jgi:hypothetical protein